MFVIVEVNILGIYDRITYIYRLTPGTTQSYKGKKASREEKQNKENSISRKK